MILFYTVFMAGEVAHVVYAARLLPYLKSKVSGPDYWIGTLFPDIRHLGLVSRHRTHPESVGLTSLVGKNDFETGMRVHAWVDATRETYWREQNMKETLPWHPFVPHALKLLEDDIVYPLFQEWLDVQLALKTIREEELYFIESREHVQRWHTILQRYFSAPPSAASRKQLSVDIGLSVSSADEINNVVEQLRSNTKATDLIEQFHVHLEQLLT